MSTGGHGSMPVVRKLTMASLLATTAIVIRGSMGIIAAFDGLPSWRQAFGRLPGLVGSMVWLGPF